MIGRWSFLRSATFAATLALGLGAVSATAAMPRPTVLPSDLQSATVQVDDDRRDRRRWDGRRWDGRRGDRDRHWDRDDRRRHWRHRRDRDDERDAYRRGYREGRNDAQWRRNYYTYPPYNRGFRTGPLGNITNPSVGIYGNGVYLTVP